MPRRTCKNDRTPKLKSMPMLNKEMAKRNGAFISLQV